MHSFINKRSALVDYILIIVGTGLLAAAIQCLFDPVSFVTGGFTGLSIVIKNISQIWFEGGIPLWFTNLALNIPVFIIAYFLKGKAFIGKTLFGTFMLSAWLYMLPVIDITEGDYMIAAVFGGALAGFGIGLVFRVNATTGGTDMVSALIQLKLRHYSIVQIMQVLDGLVVLLGLFMLGHPRRVLAHWHEKEVSHLL